MGITKLARCRGLQFNKKEERNTMKFITLLAALVLACCTATIARTQDNSSASDSTTKQSDSMKSGKSMSWVGCIAEKDGKYVLQTAKHPDGVELDTTEDLKPHVGHKVKIMGSMETSDNMKMVKVSSMKMVSETCEVGAKKTM
jgi:hypothetical protein